MELDQPVIEQPKEAEPRDGWEDDPFSCAFCSSADYGSDFVESDHDGDITEYYLHRCMKCDGEWQVKEVYTHSHTNADAIIYSPMIDPNDLKYHTEK